MERGSVWKLARPDLILWKWAAVLGVLSGGVVCGFGSDFGTA